MTAMGEQLSKGCFWPATARDVTRIAATQSNGRFSTGNRALRDPLQPFEAARLTGCFVAKTNGTFNFLSRLHRSQNGWTNLPSVPNLGRGRFGHGCKKLAHESPCTGGAVPLAEKGCLERTAVCQSIVRLWPIYAQRIADGLKGATPTGKP